MKHVSKATDVTYYSSARIGPQSWGIPPWHLNVNSRAFSSINSLIRIKTDKSCVNISRFAGYIRVSARNLHRQRMQKDSESAMLVWYDQTLAGFATAVVFCSQRTT